MLESSRIKISKWSFIEKEEQEVCKQFCFIKKEEEYFMIV